MPFKCPIKRNQHVKEYYHKNKEKIKERNKEYNKTPSRIKGKTINTWRLRGIIDDDFISLYDYYIKETHCMICFNKYTSSKNRHLDHNPKLTNEPNVRYICCTNCNTKFLAEKYNKENL